MEYLPLFETRPAKRFHRFLFQLFEASILVCISFIFVYRVNHMLTDEQSNEVTRLASFGLFLSDLWFTIYWFILVVLRWNPVYRSTFKQRLSLRYERALPTIDIFVCTADPVIEPPVMVINTVLSVMAYNYPPEKLNVYLSDDGGSVLTFYALLEASRFAGKWLPFCRKFGVEPRSPEAYFRTIEEKQDTVKDKELSSIMKLYEEMKNRIESSAKLGRVSKEIRREHKGFQEWDFLTSPRDHQTIIQILIDGRGRDPKAGKAVDDSGQPLPTLVYLAREKRPHHHHNFKAGAMNALIRVSSRISNSPIILNVDCDMYSNNSDSVRDAVCVFMDEEKGHQMAFVQFPQTFENITKNDLYASSLNVIMKFEVKGMDGNGGPPYIGTGCFHRRETLCGKTYDAGFKSNFKENGEKLVEEDISVNELEDACKVLASSTYENNTQWGKEMGLKYGCAVEDIITGLSIQCRGWKSIFLCPERKAFMGIAPTTLLQSLVQHKRWSEGDFHIFLMHSPFLKGHGNLPLKLQISYCAYLLWAVNCLSTLFYVTVPSLCFLRGISLFPKISNLWCVPFLYVFFGNRAYSLAEYIWSKGTFLGWWNDQRMWMFRRTTSYLFGFIDNILKLLGFTKSAFTITTKVVEEDVSQRYKEEVMEFGMTSPMFTILTTLALLNAFCFIGGLKKVIMDDAVVEDLNTLALQIILNGLLVSINMPIFQGLFFRRDKGKMPASVTYWSIVFALLAYSVAFY